jgi:hypothetical protein
MPADVSMSISTRGADVSAPLLVCRGMFIGASTQRTTTDRTVTSG